MHEDPKKARSDWRIPDELWERVVPPLPPRKPPPLGRHRPRVEDRQAMDASCFVLRTGCQWNTLHETGICSSRAAHRRFQEWTEVGVFLALWKSGLVAYDALRGEVDASRPARADPLGQERAQLSRVSASGLCLYHV